MHHLPNRAIFLFFIRNVFVYPIVFAGLAYVFSTPLSTYLVERYEVQHELKLLFAMFIGLIVFFLLCFVLAYLKHLFFRYGTSEQGIQIDNGILWKSSVIIPYQKIQNIDIQRSLVARILGLSTMLIQTAGSGSSEFTCEGTLPGLSVHTASKLRDDLLQHHSRK